MEALESIKNIRISDYDYPLEDGRIAKHPLAERDGCKLLTCCGGRVGHARFRDLPGLLKPGDVLVYNDTRVINARIKFRKETGSVVEVFLLEPLAPNDYVLVFQSKGACEWTCMVGNLKRWKNGVLSKEIEVDGKKVRLRAQRLGALPGNSHRVRFEWEAEKGTDVCFADVVSAAGFVPIPPYLNRNTESSDARDYQTVYADAQGSVAAPTAGLHFTAELLEAVDRRGVERESVTLHVGAGTFQPVKSEEIGGHPMHTEVFSVTRGLLESIVAAMRGGRRIVAVGTTTVRTLESLPQIGRHLTEGDYCMEVSQWEAYDDSGFSVEETVTRLEKIIEYMDGAGMEELVCRTSIMIAAGYEWRIVGGMVTNFHQPQSTLLLLVSSFLGNDHDGEPIWKKVYRAALADKDYRFLSYGDACWFERE